MAEHNSLGQIGEDAAVDFLIEKGYEILERNYRFKKAEIDVIASFDNILIAVEVKTRSRIDLGLPQDFLKPSQIKRMVTAMDHYMDKNDREEEVRFDVIAIYIRGNKMELEHLEDAFYHF